MDLDELLRSNRLNAFQVFLRIRESMQAKRPASFIRLRDGEGKTLGYPETANRVDVNYQMHLSIGSDSLMWRLSKRPYQLQILFLKLLTWTATWREEDILTLTRDMRHAVANADILGLPAKYEVKAYPPIRAVLEALIKFDLLQQEGGGRITQANSNIHLMLNAALLYRPLLENQEFVGLISSRDVGRKLKRNFGIREIRWYKIRPERDHPNDITTPHYPDAYNTIRETLEVPYPGALFLVGAGIFGLAYCQWVKERGGIAIDIGSIFDSWSGDGRLTDRPMRRLDPYIRYNRISRPEAIGRVNCLLDIQGQDDLRLDANAPYMHELPENW